ncbi:DUF4439 domain-containing protein [Arthrobacter sp. B3I4]|uniref:DUF4439 domain-containing protein n=1 Tax=Arthrobacter sp. B3I4 TaxID=3042267 RepID=UPI0027D92D4D|nr:DUF4439 domain-containing protein [Arthrobacter sp. B3I4]
MTLLTTQARALLRPDPAASPPAPGASGATGSTGATGTTGTTGASGATAAAAPAAPATATVLAADLAGSGRQRLADAASADGGMARLLAAVGTAQLLQSSALARAAGAPDPAAGLPDIGIPETGLPGAGPDASASAPAASAGALPCPSEPASPSGASAAGGTPAAGTSAGGTADLPGALAAVISTELETVYGYQVALTRLDGGPAKTAAEQLARHEALVAAAESLGRAHCARVPPREAGYALEQGFLASPGPALAALETASLNAYGDLVALSDGDVRQWAMAGLVGAARRAALCGGTPGPLPGLAADPASFPSLPAG